MPETKPARRNKLNDLDPKTWLKFQKSWFVHNPPPRQKGVLLHPAKFPETLAQEFVEFFTKKGGTVLDPMVGTGSTLVACLRARRRGVGIELNPKQDGVMNTFPYPYAEGTDGPLIYSHHYRNVMRYELTGMEAAAS